MGPNEKFLHVKGEIFANNITNKGLISNKLIQLNIKRKKADFKMGRRIQ